MIKQLFCGSGLGVSVVRPGYTRHSRGTKIEGKLRYVTEMVHQFIISISFNISGERLNGFRSKLSWLSSQ